MSGKINFLVMNKLLNFPINLSVYYIALFLKVINLFIILGLYRPDIEVLENLYSGC